jgi:hypothetical protein
MDNNPEKLITLTFFLPSFLPFFFLFFFSFLAKTDCCGVEYTVFAQEAEKAKLAKAEAKKKKASAL